MFQTPETLPASNGSIGRTAALLRGTGALATLLRGNELLASRYETVLAIQEATAETHEGSLRLKGKSREDLQDADAARAEALDRAARPDGTPLTAAALAELDATIAAARRRDTEADRRSSATNRTQAESREAANAVTWYVNNLAPDAAVKPAKLPAVKGDALAVVEQQRARIGQIKAETERTRRAVPPLDAAERMVIDQVARLADEGAVKVRVGTGGPVLSFPVEVVRAEPTGDEVPVATNAAAMLAALFPKQMEAAALGALRATYDAIDRPALSPDEKMKTLKRLDIELLDAERLEVEAVFAAHRAGLPVWFRAATNPRAILGIE